MKLPPTVSVPYSTNVPSVGYFYKFKVIFPVAEKKNGDKNIAAEIREFYKRDNSERFASAPTLPGFEIVTRLEEITDSSDVPLLEGRFQVKILGPDSTAENLQFLKDKHGRELLLQFRWFYISNWERVDIPTSVEINGPSKNIVDEKETLDILENIEKKSIRPARPSFAFGFKTAAKIGSGKSYNTITVSPVLLEPVWPSETADDDLLKWSKDMKTLHEIEETKQKVKRSFLYS